MHLAGLAGCRRPIEKIIPYVVAPEEIVPGIPNYYATSMQRGYDSIGLIIENHEGRPTKIEGNEKHPSSLGKTDSFTQAEILNLYDPDRSKNVLKNGEESTQQKFITAWSELYNTYIANGGDGLVIISNPSIASTFSKLKKDFHRTFPNAKWIIYEPVSDENIINGTRIATGTSAKPVYSLEKAKVILSLDSDFLLMESGSVRNSMGFANGRRVKSEKDDMNRLYVAESSMSVTGGMADHRIIIKNDEIGDFTVAVALELHKQGVTIQSASSFGITSNFDNHLIKELVADLISNRGKSLITVGRNQPEQVHALATSINIALGNIGKTISYYNIDDDMIPNSSVIEDITASTVILIGTNPVYSAIKDSRIINLIKNAEHSIHLGSHVDETAQYVEWHINQTHFLEEWNDTQSLDGSVGIVNLKSYHYLMELVILN